MYDLINNSSVFLEKDKKHLLTREVYKIATSFPVTDFLSYFKKFEFSVKDTAVVNRIKRNFSLLFDEKANDTKSLALLDINRKPLTFDYLKERHIGKVIYVDFWASWCGPCREAFPYSARLRDELKGKNVVFIYLSIDQTLKPWQLASEKEKLSMYSENYLVVNYKKSNFAKQQRLGSIPRYMIFDKQGKLVYPNAPRVESKNLKSLLLELAKK